MSRRVSPPLLLLLLTSLLSLALPTVSAVADHGVVGENARITSPTDGSRVSGTAYRITVADGPYHFSDYPRLYLDGVALDTPRPTYDSAAQLWTTDWDTTQMPSNIYKLQVGGPDGPNAASPVTVEVANSTPIVRFTAPNEGAHVSGPVTLAVDAFPNARPYDTITKVVFNFPEADPGGAVTDFEPPYTATIDTAGFANGPTLAFATAYTSNGQSASSHRQIYVNNVAPPAMTIRQSASLITAGQPLTVAVTAQPGEPIKLLGYSRPATTFRTLRTGTADSSGRVIFTLKPVTNTRFYAANATDSARKTGSLVVSVRPRLSMQAYQEGRTVIFWGMSSPCSTGRAVSVYRLASTGRVLTASGRLDCRPNYANISVYKTFSGRGTYDFIAVTAADGVNAAAQSPVIRYTVR